MRTKLWKPQAIGARIVQLSCSNAGSKSNVLEGFNSLIASSLLVPQPTPPLSFSLLLPFDSSDEHFAEAYYTTAKSTSYALHAVSHANATRSCTCFSWLVRTTIICSFSLPLGHDVHICTTYVQGMYTRARLQRPLFTRKSDYPPNFGLYWPNDLYR